MAQKLYFREYIDAHPDWELHDIYADEGITGTSTKNRSEFLRMIRDAQNRSFQLILTKEISRFSRNILDTIHYTRALKELGVGVLFLSENLNTMNPESEMLLAFMGTLAQEESRRTSVRVKWGQTRRMEQGVVFGPSLLGYRVSGGKIAVEPEGAEVVRLIFQKYGLEKKGTSVICKELREAGYRTPTGNPDWSPGQIVKILKNEKYVGDLVQKKSITPDYLSHEKRKNRGEEELVILRDHHEGIVSRDLWNSVQEEILRHNRRRTAESGGHSGPYACSGKIKCGECGAAFVSRVKRQKDGSAVRRWRCAKSVSQGALKRKDETGHVTGCDIGWLLRDEAALAMVAAAIASLKLEHKNVVLHVLEAITGAIQGGACAERELERVQRELDRLEKKKTKALDACFSGEITEEELFGIRSNYEEEIVRLRKRREGFLARKEDERDLTKRAEREMCELLSGKKVSELLCKTLVKEIVVFRSREVHLSLSGIAQTFVFREEKTGAD